MSKSKWIIPFGDRTSIHGWWIDEMASPDSRGRHIFHRRYRLGWRDLELSCEATIPSDFCQVRVSIDEESVVNLHVSCFLFAVWLGIDAHQRHSVYTDEPHPRTWLGRWLEGTKHRRRYGDDREFCAGFRASDSSMMGGTFFLTLWGDPHGWSSRDPWWRRGVSFSPVDFLAGKARHSTRDIRTVETTLMMPEGTYPVRVKLYESEWKRPRWPFPVRLRRAETSILMQSGVPIPGKGENAWDIGDDAVFSQTAPARDEHEALAGLYESVMRDRARHGGHNWRPEPVSAD